MTATGRWAWMGEMKIVRFRALGIWGRKEGEQSRNGGEDQNTSIYLLVQ